MTCWRFIFLFFSLAALSSPAFGLSANTDYPAGLVAQAHSLKLDQDPYWLTLLQYRARWFGGVRSEIKATGFFASKEGGTNPSSELDATIARFFEPVSSDVGVQHPQCLWIDRYQWLKKRLHFDGARLKEQPCKDYQEWRGTLDPESVTLIFSSYYMSNPSSTFGHTLLRLNHRKHSIDERLLDYGVNYAANQTTQNAFLYGFLGLTGGFDGVFSNVPYFMKVEEYNDVESRELWEYDLNFSAEQIDRLMFHLWTVGHFSTPYYFLDKNCSFMILGLLDAANPALKLGDQFQNSIFVIPADTVRAVASRPGLVTRIRVRPSLAYRMRRQEGTLSGSDRKLFFDIIADPESAPRFQAIVGAQNSPRIFDFILDDLRYLKIKDKNKLPPAEQSLQTKTLIARSELPEKTADIELTDAEIEKARPDFGHDTFRVSVGGGDQAVNGGFVELGVRPLFHDLNASTLGYPAGAQIEFLDLDAHYSPAPGLLRFERVNLLDIVSINPWDRLFQKFSWSLRLGGDPVRDFQCNDCFEYKSELGAGESLRVMDTALFYFLMKAELGFGADYTPGYRLGPGAELGSLIRVDEDLSFDLKGNYHHPVLGYLPAYFQESAEARVSLSKDTDVRLGFDHYPITTQERVTLNVYF